MAVHFPEAPKVVEGGANKAPCVSADVAGADVSDKRDPHVLTGGGEDGLCPVEIGAGHQQSEGLSRCAAEEFFFRPAVELCRENRDASAIAVDDQNRGVPVEMHFRLLQRDASRGQVGPALGCHVRQGLFHVEVAYHDGTIAANSQAGAVTVDQNSPF